MRWRQRWPISRYIAAPVDIIRHVLAGEFSLDAEGNRRIIDDYFTFHAGFANYPRPSQALWIYSQMIRWGQADHSARTACTAAASAYRPDLYRAALGETPHRCRMTISGSKAAADGDRFMDGQVFDPARIADYVAGFPVRSALPLSARWRRNLTFASALHKISQPHLLPTTSIRQIFLHDYLPR